MEFFCFTFAHAWDVGEVVEVGEVRHCVRDSLATSLRIDEKRGLEEKKNGLDVR